VKTVAILFLILAASVTLAAIEWKEKAGLQRPTVVDTFWVTEFTNTVLPFEQVLIYAIETKWMISSNAIESAIADLKSGAIPANDQMKTSIDSIISNSQVSVFQVLDNGGKQFRNTHVTVIPVDTAGTSSTTTL